MKIRIVSSRDDIPGLAPNEKIVHIAFRPSNKDVFQIVEACPKIEAVQLPKSYRSTLSKSIEMFLEMQKIVVIEGDVWGHRKDLSEHKTVSEEIFKDLDGLIQKKTETDEICHTMLRKWGLSGSFVKYLLANIPAA